MDGAASDAASAGSADADASAVDGSVSGPTAAGTPLAAGETKTIGAAGGSFTSADGQVTLTFPEGALPGDTLIGIHMLTNTAPDGIDNAYELRSEAATFAKPVQVSFQISSDDLATAGGALDAVEIGYQDTDGLWHWFGDQQHDAGANTVTISTTHFTPYGKRTNPAKVKNVPPPPGTPQHYLIRATFTAKHLLVCTVETADVLDGFSVTVLEDANGALSIPTEVSDQKTMVLNEQFLMQEYPEGGSVKWTRDPEIFDSNGASVERDSNLIKLTIMSVSDGGYCEFTINGAFTDIPTDAGCPRAPTPLIIEFDPSKLPITSPADVDGFAYDITKF